MELHIIGIDLSETVFHLAGLNRVTDIAIADSTARSLKSGDCLAPRLAHIKKDRGNK